MDLNESTHLISTESKQNGSSKYGGQDETIYANTSSYAYDNSSFTTEYTNLEGGSFSVGSASSSEHETAAEILYRLKFSFLDKELKVDEQIAEVQNSLSGQDKISFKEEILEGLKNTPLTIRQKLQVYRVVTTDHVNRRRNQNSQKYIKAKSRKSNADFIQLWESSITKLTAYFGSNVASYFAFLRTLFYLNFFTGIILFSFTTVPQFISGDFTLDDIPSNLVNISGHLGELSNSLLFYGAYRDDYSEKHGGYQLPLAYFLSWASVNLLTIGFIVFSMYIRYRRSKLDEKGNEYPFTWATFCSLDFSINTKDGIKDHIQAFCTDLKEKIREEQSLHVRTWIKRFSVFMGRLTSNVLVLGLLGGSGYLIYYVAQELTIDDFPEEMPEFIKDLLERYQLAVVVAFLKLFVPFIFELLVKIESLHPRTKLKITIARTTFFYYASLVVFIISLSNLANCAGHDSTCVKPSFNSTLSNMTVSQNKTEFCCWENQVGEEIFKLILVDLGVCIAVGLLFHVMKAAFIRCGVCCMKIGYSEFAVTSNVLDLVYGQGLVWLGLYFSPLLALIGTIKLFIVFYFRYFVARFSNIPPKKMFRASRSGSFYLFLLLMTWLLCFIPVAYFIVDKTPSWHCGPFKCESKVYDIVKPDISLPDWLNWLNTVVEYLGTAIVIIPLIVLLILLVLYYRVKSSSYSDLIQELRKQLVFERKVERKKVFATALSAPAGSIGKASGTTITTELH